MRKNFWLLISIVGCSITLFYVYTERHSQNLPVVESDAESTHQIAQIEIVSGNEFYLKLADGRRLKMHLAIQTVPESKSKVIGLINSTKLPRVKLRKRELDGWVGDILLTQNGQEISLSDWLTVNKMVLE